MCHNVLSNKQEREHLKSLVLTEQFFRFYFSFKLESSSYNDLNFGFYKLENWNVFVNDLSLCYTFNFAYDC